MIRSIGLARVAFGGLVSSSICFAACASNPGEEASVGDQEAIASCASSVTQNAYDGPNYWGTLAFKNGSTSVSGVSVDFDVPAGAHCTNDSVPSGATLSPLNGSGSSATTTSNHCTFTFSGSLVANATKTFNYSTDTGTSFTAKNVVVKFASCTGTTPPPPPVDAGAPHDASVPDTSTPPPPPPTDNLVWHQASKTNFTSYPDPGSAECIEYNGCAYEGQFAALDGTQSLAWVKSHNIVAVHSKDFNKYKLHNLRLRKGTKTIDVVVYDECADSDCSGCCTQNAKPSGYLIDVESYTDQRWGVPDGQIEWACLDPGCQ